MGICVHTKFYSVPSKEEMHLACQSWVGYLMSYGLSFLHLYEEVLTVGNTHCAESSLLKASSGLRQMCLQQRWRMFWALCQDFLLQVCWAGLPFSPGLLGGDFS